MGIRIGAKPDSGFDDPIGILKDCHRRIEHFRGVLCTVMERALNRSLSEEAIAAVQAAINYFRTGGQPHTADEEKSLSPRLVAAGRCDELDALEHDQAEAGQLHTDVEALYKSWISGGSFTELQQRRLQSSTARLRDLYQAHIAIEDNIVFPKAARMLDKSVIEAIIQEFRARRK